MTSLDDLAQKVNSMTGEEMFTLVRKVESILRNERYLGKQGDLEIAQGLVRIPSSGDLIVVGDLHGDLDSLIGILSNSHAVEMADEGRGRILFLGDYGDRGEKSPEAYFVVLSLKSLFPASVILLRGNHEGPRDLQASPYDLPYQFRGRFHDLGRQISSEIEGLFETLHHAVILDEKYLFLHGGVPSLAQSLDEIAQANLTHPGTTHLEEILWSDPVDGMEGTAPSPRGAGRLFGEDVTGRVLNLTNVKTLIRGHEPCHDGFFVSHRGMILTIFSRKGPPYNNRHAAYLRIDASHAPVSADKLSRFMSLL